MQHVSTAKKPDICAEGGKVVGQVCVVPSVPGGETFCLVIFGGTPPLHAGRSGLCICPLFGWALFSQGRCLLVTAAGWQLGLLCYIYCACLHACAGMC